MGVGGLRWVWVSFVEWSGVDRGVGGPGWGWGGEGWWLGVGGLVLARAASESPLWKCRTCTQILHPQGGLRRTQMLFNRKDVMFVGRMREVQDPPAPSDQIRSAQPNPTRPNPTQTTSPGQTSPTRPDLTQPSPTRPDPRPGLDSPPTQPD